MGKIFALSWFLGLSCPLHVALILLLIVPGILVTSDSVNFRQVTGQIPLFRNSPRWLRALFGIGRVTQPEGRGQHCVLAVFLSGSCLTSFLWFPSQWGLEKASPLNDSSWTLEAKGYNCFCSSLWAFSQINPVLGVYLPEEESSSAFQGAAKSICLSSPIQLNTAGENTNHAKWAHFEMMTINLKWAPNATNQSYYASQVHLLSHSPSRALNSLLSSQTSHISSLILSLHPLP